MKIISLNTWGGRAGKKRLLDFFKKHRADTDVFCLQEMWSAPYDDMEGVLAGGRALRRDEIMTRGVQEIGEILPDFACYFRPHFGDRYGLAMFVKKSMPVDAEGELFVHKHRGYVPEGDVGNHARNIQFVEMQYEGAPLTVINFHGLWNGQGKGDSADRLEQSKKIAAFVGARTGNVVLCGDFNLTPHTRSLAILEEIGLRNLIKEYGIVSTRTSFYEKPEKFADYVLVSPNLRIRKFEVLPDEVSDHAALLMEF